MEQITLRLPSDVLEDVEAEADEHDRTRSEHLRDVIKSRNEHAEDVERLRERIDELETEVERLRNEKRTILNQREENTELRRYAETERSLRERRARAGVLERAKWWAFGMPDDE